MAYPRVQTGMSARLLSAALLIVVACAVAIALALRGGNDEPRPAPGSGAATRSAADRELLRRAGGPAGSGVVTLSQWRYRGDPSDRGIAAGWSSGDFRGRLVRVPHSPNAKAFSGEAGRRAFAGSVGWYAKDIKAPVGGRYAIRFESVHHRATVFVDGRRVRRHTGAYEPFTARPQLAPGRHTVVVRVDWRDPRRQALAGWARAWFNYGGIHRPVTLSRLGPSGLGALTVRTRRPARDHAQVAIEVRVRNRVQARSVRLRGVLSRGDDRHALNFGVRRVGAGTSRTFELTVRIDDPALWSPQRPERYDLRIDVPGESTLRRKIGLRELAWGAGGLKLNGAPLVLRGAALPADARGHGDAFIDADEARIVKQLEAVGANATRSQLPLSESMLERLDAAGILVWQIIGPWQPAGAWDAETPQQIAAARGRALRVAEAQQPFASIVAWSLTNEAAGGGQPGEQAYVSATARRLHARDPSRPVALDLWGSRLPNAPGPMFSELDVIGVTDYVGWYERNDQAPAAQDELTHTRISRLRELFPDKPLVMTEIGAAGSGRVAGDGFGGLRFQADLLGRRLRMLTADPALSGTLVWSLRDYALRPDFRGGSVLRLRPGLTLTPGLNEKGLFDFYGRRKPSLAAVRDAFAG